MFLKNTILALLLGAAAPAVVAAQNDTSTCHDYVIVSTRGTFEAQGPSIGFARMIEWTLGNVTNGIERDTVYPAAQNQTYYLGANDIVSYLSSAISSCPQQRYVLLGYSQGASATGAALHNYTDTNAAIYKAIQAVLVIGNPFKIPNKDSDVDQDGATSNRNLRGALYNETGSDAYGNGIPDIYYANGKLLDICFANDAICAPASANASLQAHIQYGFSDSVQEMGAKFLVGKLTATNATSGADGMPVTSSTTGSGPATATSNGVASMSSAAGNMGTSLELSGFSAAMGLVLMLVGVCL